MICLLSPFHEHSVSPSMQVSSLVRSTERQVKRVTIHEQKEEKGVTDRAKTVAASGLWLIFERRSEFYLVL